MMGISFILPLFCQRTFSFSADQGGSTGAKNWDEEVKLENVLSHKLTAHTEALRSMILSQQRVYPCQSQDAASRDGMCL